MRSKIIEEISNFKTWWGKKVTGSIFRKLFRNL